jgi:hypothetical protein
LETFLTTAPEDIDGIAQLVNSVTRCKTWPTACAVEIGELAAERQKERLEAELGRVIKEGGKRIKRTITIAPKPSRAEIDALIRSLEKLRAEMGLYDDIDITIELATP